MLLILVAAAIGFAVGGFPVALVGAGIIMGGGVLIHLATPKEQRETMHEYRMRTDRNYREMRLAAKESGRETYYR